MLFLSISTDWIFSKLHFGPAKPNQACLVFFCPVNSSQYLSVLRLPGNQVFFLPHRFPSFRCGLSSTPIHCHLKSLGETPHSLPFASAQLYYLPIRHRSSSSSSFAAIISTQSTVTQFGLDSIYRQLRFPSIVEFSSSFLESSTVQLKSLPIKRHGVPHSLAPFSAAVADRLRCSRGPDCRSV